MLEKPNLVDETISACLLDSYGVNVTDVEFLPIGNDAKAWVYKVSAGDGDYFLKVKRGAIYEPVVAVPRFLNDSGITQVVAPLRTRTQMLWQRVDDFSLILYPFIEGKTGGEVGLSDAQWREFGAILKRIHNAPLSGKLTMYMHKEIFVPKWITMVKRLHTNMSDNSYEQLLEKELAAFWNSKYDEIEKIVARAEAIGRLLAQQRLDFVLCHADIHTFNILVDRDGRLFIVDWDETIFAPKERDLMFVSGAMFDGSKEQRLFYGGYGATDINALAIAYYRYEWVVQEIGDFGERVFLAQDIGVETKREAVEGFMQLFEAGDVVNAAYESERDLSPELRESLGGVNTL